MQHGEAKGQGRSNDNVLISAIQALKNHPYLVFPLAIAVLAVTAGGIWGRLDLAIALMLFAVVVLVIILMFANRISDRGPEMEMPDEAPIASGMTYHATNLGFEESAPGTAPTGWFDSEGYVEGVSTAYKAKVVERTDGSGNYVLFQNPSARSGEFGSLMQRIPARRLAGKMVRLECEISTKRVQELAGMWLRADAEDGRMVFFDNMGARPIRGS
ncbi:MAG TPA: hypothetical protein VJQ54_15525, partial [Candidatus Sulfotelmatobacter sp.]|nr:hypothetical protein [Candidatus Sulfotelmatobacter sp.]